MSSPLAPIKTLSVVLSSSKSIKTSESFDWTNITWFWLPPLNIKLSLVESNLPLEVISPLNIQVPATFKLPDAVICPPSPCNSTYVSTPEATPGKVVTSVVIWNLDSFPLILINSLSLIIKSPIPPPSGVIPDLHLNEYLSPVEKIQELEQRIKKIENERSLWTI